MNNGRLLIADFGLSKNLTEVSSNLRTLDAHGCTGYIEPQCIKDDEYKKDKKSDIYSLGVLLWEITSGHPPFHKIRDRKLLITRVCIMDHREQPVEGTPSDYVELYQKCWDKDPNLRPNIDEVYEKLKSLQHSDPEKLKSSQYLDPRISNEHSSMRHDSGIGRPLPYSITSCQIGK